MHRFHLVDTRFYQIQVMIYFKVVTLPIHLFTISSARKKLTQLTFIRPNINTAQKHRYGKSISIAKFVMHVHLMKTQIL